MCNTQTHTHKHTNRDRKIARQTDRELGRILLAKKKRKKKSQLLLRNVQEVIFQYIRDVRFRTHKLHSGRTLDIFSENIEPMKIYRLVFVY